MAELSERVLNVTIDVTSLTPKFKALEEALEVAQRAFEDLIEATDDLEYTYTEEEK